MKARTATVLVGLVLAGALALSACASGWSGGIHARLAFSETHGLRVLEVPPDSAAARAGLAVGDRIVAIDDEPVEGRPMSDVVRALRGDVGTRVRLRIMRGIIPRTIEVERAPYAQR